MSINGGGYAIPADDKKERDAKPKSLGQCDEPALRCSPGTRIPGYPHGMVHQHGKAGQATPVIERLVSAGSGERQEGDGIAESDDTQADITIRRRFVG